MNISNGVILLLMIFYHIIDDYGLQGILASMKQKKYWKENHPDKIYKYDYIMALIMHGFSWSFMVSLPILIFYYKGYPSYNYYMILITNMLLHAFIDNKKCNKFEINLLQDQYLHLMQIFSTYLILMIIN